MKARPELCTAMVQFPTVKVNGIFGTFDYPPMSRGMLMKQKHCAALIAYVKSVLPDAHPLSHKGWRELPPGACTLPEIAAPGGPRCSPAAQPRLLRRGARARATS
eukprot:3281144-Prymnesium_polylepis.1